MLKSNRKTWFSVSLVFGLVLVSCLLPSATSAEATASLYFLPNSGTFEAGQTFNVRAAVNTGGQVINAVEDTISFSNNTLEITSISKAETILTLWVKDLLYDNSTGKITFAGGIPNPGFNGLGRLFRVYFKAKSHGSAWIKFNAAKVLANDGIGTNILSSLGRADLTIKERTLPAPVPVELPKVSLIIPEISSSTHPDPNKWYTKRDIIFTWNWQQGITDYSYIFNKAPKTIPDNSGDRLDTSISYLDVADGVWYFHIKPETRTGWGSTVHRQVRIDATEPSELNIISAQDFPAIDPSPKFSFEAEDKMAGIDRLEVQIDKGEIRTLVDTLEYTAPFLRPGQHQITVSAYDRADNSIEDSLIFEILPLRVPKITYWTRELLFGEPLLVKGLGGPNNKINVTIISEDGKEFVAATTSNEDGLWLVEYKDILRKGKYRFIVTQETELGVLSSPSEEKAFTVLTNVLRMFGIVWPVSALMWLIIFLLAVIIILIILIFLLHRPLFKKIKIILKK